jgi:hypothetical protein
MRSVIVALLVAFSFPAISQAKSAPDPTPISEMGRTGSSPSTPPSGPSLAELAAREQHAKQLADFRGGGVYIYAGSGAMLVLVVVLLVLLI